MIITIGGNVGAGKSVLAARLAKTFHYDELYVGRIFRKMAEERNISIDQFYEELKNDPATEQEVDKRQAEAMRKQDGLVVQGRIAWYFAKGSPFKIFNILLIVDPAIGAARSGTRKEYTGKTAEEMVAMTATREKMEKDRYKMLYGIENHLDPTHYDFVLDTSNISENEVLEKVIEKINHR